MTARQTGGSGDERRDRGASTPRATAPAEAASRGEIDPDRLPDEYRRAGE